MERNFPIGVQVFKDIINEEFIYVDKTKYIYELAHTGKYYFLSRPRRFGKSLFLSTLMEYWLGNRELFSGLDIERLEKNNPDAWKRYPVFYLDFNKEDYQMENALEGVLDKHLRKWEKIYGCNNTNQSLAARFQDLIEEANAQSGLGCVVLVDEYDKPLLDTIDNPELNDHNRAVFRGFFSALKSYSGLIKFAFITGVTKFSKVSIFSDLNNLKDLSMEDKYSGICGITEAELVSNFRPEIEAFAEEQNTSVDDCLIKLRETYDGYHFSEKSEGVYNPFSLLNSLDSKKYDYYWFETGTPSFLLKMLKNGNFDLSRLTGNEIYVSRQYISNYKTENKDPVPLMYQTGYLTIVDADPTIGEYTLGFPNNEVKFGFLECLLPIYIDTYSSMTGLDVLSLRKHLVQGRVDDVRKVLEAFFSGIPYSEKEVPFEAEFRNILYAVFTCLGSVVKCETRINRGRIDCIVETDKYVYLFELKVDSSADEALKQIDSKDYALPYKADGRKLYKIGVNFSSETRMLEDWKVI